MDKSNAFLPRIFTSTATPDMCSLSPIFRRAGLNQLLQNLEALECLPIFILDEKCKLQFKQVNGAAKPAPEQFLDWVSCALSQCPREYTQTGERATQTEEIQSLRTVPKPLKDPQVSTVLESILSSLHPLPPPSNSNSGVISLRTWFQMQLPHLEADLFTIDDLEVLTFKCYESVGLRTTYRVREERQGKVCVVLISERRLCEALAQTYRKAKFLAHVEAMSRLEPGFFRLWLEKYQSQFLDISA